MPIVASIIDSTKHATANDLNQQYEIFAANSALYCALITDTPSLKFQMWKSTDDGQTWTVQDNANSPVWQGCVFFDGSIAYVACVDANHVAPQSRIFIDAFDTATDTWSHVANTGPQAQQLSQIWQRSDGSFVVLYDAGNPRTPGKEGSTRLWSVVWDGANWVDDQDTGINSGLTGDTGATAIFAIASSATVDADDRVHVFFCNPSPFTQFWYQAIESDNSLGSSHQFTEPIGTWDTNACLGTPVTFGDFVVCGASFLDGGTSYGGVLIGTPLAAPVWSSNPQIDTTPDTDRPPQMIYDTSTGTVASVITTYYSGNPAGLIRIAQSQSLSDPSDGWTSETFYILGTDTTPAGADLSFGMFKVLCGPGSALILATMFITFLTPAVYIGLFPFTGSAPVTPSNMVNASGLPTFVLPRGMTLDASGANRSCFPIKPKKGPKCRL